MAISKVIDDGEVLEFSLNNGHLKAINKIKEDWGLKDAISVIEFGLAVLYDNKDRLIVENGEKKLKILEPGEQLLESKHKPSPNAA